MDQNGKEPTFISIKDLFFFILKRIGIVLLAGVILGGVLFGYKAAKKTNTSNVLDTSVRLSDGETDIQYQARLDNVGRARDIVDNIAKINLQIDIQRRYISDSLYMQINPENEYEANIQVVLKLEDNDTGGLDTALMSAYEYDIKAGSYLNDYADKIGTRPDYIKELIIFSSKTTDSTILTVNDPADRAGSMSIRIYGPTEEFVDDVTEIVTNECRRFAEDLKKTVANHSISVLDVNKMIRIDSNTRDGQVNQVAKLETLQKQIVTCNESLDKVAKDLGLSGKNDILSTFEEQAAAEAAGTTYEFAKNSGIKSIIKSGAKFGILGFAGGMVLVMLVLLLKYIFGSKIFTQTQFFNNFTQIRKIGVLKPTGKRSKLASFADLKTEDDSLLSADNNKKLISANFANITKEYGKVLITGTGDSKAAGEAVKAMGLKGDFKPDIFNSPDILKSIPDYDAVVIIEQRGNSLFRNVANEIELINNGGTKIVGAILI